MAANHPELVSIVQREAHLPPEQAERALRATLKTLGERLSGGEARDLADDLPESVAAELSDGERAEPFDIGEFLRRVGEREGVSKDEARAHARAVFAALGFVVRPAELRDMAAQLPKDYAPLLEAAMHPPVPPPLETPVPTHAWSTQKILDRVAERAGIDVDTARRATEATLETLAERISAGQARDLESWLPQDLRAPIEEVNRRRKNDHPEPFAADVFVKRVAEREAVSDDEAREHARAVLTTLREAVSQKEFRDTLAQLPREYRDELLVA
jgi:uncharacterized protein (DUF2267 family)